MNRHNNWNQKPLGELTEILDGKRKPISKELRTPGPIPYYGACGVVDFVDSFLFDEPLVLVGEDGAKWGQGESTAFIVTGKSWVNNHAHVLRPNREILDDYWLVCWLNSQDLSQYISGLTVPKLNQANLRGIPIPLPPLAEQRKIAEILRTWDEAIETAEAELNAKQERKRWLMDKLLVGDWAAKKLDDLFELEGSGIDKVILQGEQVVPLVNYMDAYRKRILEPSDITAQTSVSPADLNRCKLKRGDIVLTPSSETPDDIAHSALIDFEPGDAVHSYHLFRLRARSDSAIVHDFRAFFLNHISVRKQFIRICSGTTRFTLTLPGVRGIKVSLPPVEHQEYAAAVLGDATSQEALASQKIEALRAQKRGLMQKLLTGQVRVAA